MTRSPSTDGFVDGLQGFGLPPPCRPATGLLTVTPVGLAPTEHVSLSWTHNLECRSLADWDSLELSLRGARATLVLWSASSWPSWAAAYACTHTLPDSGEGYSPRVRTEYKGDYAVGSLPTRQFFANETYFHLLLLAYNLVNWFKRLCLPPAFQNATLQTLRHRILLIPAQLRRTENRPRLILPASGPGEAAWKYAIDRIHRLKV